MEVNYQSRLCELRTDAVGMPEVSDYLNRLYVKTSFLKVISSVACTELTHVTYNVEDPHLPHPYKILFVENILKGDLVGHHVLIDVPRTILKPCIAKLKFAVKKNGGKSTSAIF